MVEKFDANFACAPNFAFALLLKRLKMSCKSSDWSTMTRIILGGEPTRADVIAEITSVLHVEPDIVWICME